jgi:hypothetical protein
VHPFERVYEHRGALRSSRRPTRFLLRGHMLTMTEAAMLLIGFSALGCYGDPSHPCIAGLDHGASYKITLGDLIPDVPLHPGSTSCNQVKEFDSLATGSAMNVTLPKGQWMPNQYCEVPLADLSTDLGLMLTPIGNFAGSANGGQPPEDMFVVNEKGASGSCPIQWSLGAVSRNGVAAFPPGTPGQDLFVVREVVWTEGPSCPAPIAESGASACFDAWKFSLEKLP